MRDDLPDPVISVSVEAKSKGEQEKLGQALGKMVRSDPSLRLELDKESGQTILRGMGELHLEITIDRIRTEYGVEANVGRPQVAYREAITAKHEHVYTHKKQTGGSGQYAEIKVVFEPLERGMGFEFVDKIVGGSIPREFIPAVEYGLKVQKEEGVLAGFPMTMIRRWRRRCADNPGTPTTSGVAVPGRPPAESRHHLSADRCVPAIAGRAARDGRPTEDFLLPNTAATPSPRASRFRGGRHRRRRSVRSTCRSARAPCPPA